MPTAKIEANAETETSSGQPRIQKKAKQTGIWLTGILLLVILLAPGLVTACIYRKSFGQRFSTPVYYAFYLEEFPGLQRTKHEFSSNQGQKISAYYYYTEKTTPKALMILAHSFGGGGHNNYLDIINFFAQRGYGVFAYDASGNDESEGLVEGFPQGLIDLDYAISYAENSEALPKLPLVLWGHSWGAYASTAVLKFHPEIQAVAAFSGFNSPADLIEIQGREQMGGWIDLLLPYLKIYEKIKFGQYAGVSSLAGFAGSETPVMLIQGGRDKTVPAACGYDTWQAAYREDARFNFILRPGLGHNDVYYSEQAVAYLASFKQAYNLWVSQLAYDSKSKTHQAQFQKDKSDYILTHLDRDQWTHLIDEALMQEVCDFYAAQLER